MSERQSPPVRLSLDDDCPRCGERLLHHPRTLVELKEPGTFGWAFRVCDGTILRLLPEEADDDDEVR